MLTTLETGTAPFSNPQKSPSEHTHLHEQTVAHLSGFKATKLPTPGEFRWTIYQLAALILKQTWESPCHSPQFSHSQTDDHGQDKDNGSFALKMSRFLLVSCGGDSLGASSQPPGSLLWSGKS